MQLHKLACSYTKLHAVTWACMQLHKLTCSSFLRLSSSQEFRSACLKTCLFSCLLFSFYGNLYLFLSSWSVLRSLHRVRAVYGAQKRIIAILSYHTQPGRSGSPRYFVNACLWCTTYKFFLWLSLNTFRKNAWLYGERVEKIYKERGLLWSRCIWCSWILWLRPTKR